MCDLPEQIHIIARSLVNSVSIWSHFYCGWWPGDHVLFLKIVIIIFIRLSILIVIVCITLICCWFRFELIKTVVLYSQSDWLDASIVNYMLPQVLLLLTIWHLVILSGVWLSRMSRFKSFPPIPLSVLLRVHNLIRHVALHSDRVCLRLDD